MSTTPEINQIPNGSGPISTPAYSPALKEWGINSPWQALFEYVPDLLTRPMALRTYEKMRRNDAQVRATLRACKIPILAASWHIHPASDTKLDHEIAEFVEYNLFEYLKPHWLKTLEEILYMFDFGFSILEPVFELGQWAPLAKGRRTRPVILLNKLAPRPAVTIYRFHYRPNGDPESLEQYLIDPETNARRGQPVNIPIEQLLVFTYEQQGGNLEGLSMLRSAYKHWYMKDNLYKIDAIQKERHGMGVPRGKLPPGASSEDERLGGELLSHLRVNEKGYILEPPGWDIGFADVPGNLVNALESANHHDLMIARNVLAQFINAVGGSQASGGGRAASAVMIDMFYKSLLHVSRGISAIINCYLIPRLVKYNYDVQRFPQIHAHKVGDSKEFQMAAAALSNLAKNFLITPDEDTENMIREDIDLPPRHKSSPTTRPKTPPPQSQGGSDTTTGNVGE